MYLDSICGSPFWDTKLTWDTEDPDFTPCFHKTALIWGPCLFFWLFSPLEIYYLVSSKCRNIPWSWLNIAKLIALIILVLQCLVDLVVIGYDAVILEKHIYHVDYLTPIVKLLTFIFVASLVYANKVRGMRCSGHLFFFWTFLAICGAFEYRTSLRKAFSEHPVEPLYPLISYLVYYPIVFASLVLNFFADLPPKEHDYLPTSRPCPDLAASFPSKLVFQWFQPLAKTGFERPLEVTDLWSMKDEDTARLVVPKFDKYWQKTLSEHINSRGPKAAFLKRSHSVEFEPGSDKTRSSEKNASILPALVKAFGPTFIFGSVLKLMQDILTFVSPQLLSLIINFVEKKKDEYAWRGYLYAVALFLTASVQTVLLSQYFTRMFYVGLRIRTALISAIYRKALRISNASRKESTVGEIVNLMAVDAQRFMDLLTYLNMIWSAPLQIALAVFFLWNLLGPSVLAGLAVMIILIPVNGFVATKVKALQIKQMKYKDERVKLMNEILAGIKVLKLYAWEKSFEQQVLKIRDKEIGVLKRAAYLNATTSFIWACAPFMVSLVTFAVYVLSDENNVLNAKTAFVSLSLFNILRFPLSMLPMLISNIVQASVSVQRINKFLNMTELDPSAVSHDETEKAPLIVENGFFSWGGPEPLLRNINMRVEENALVAVVGTVGSGKSSLLSSLLGEMERVSGRVNIKGSVAYVAQQAWIQNATLRDNILFGKPFNMKSYNKVVDACALRPDFDMLPGGDSTEIGEKGINLSGGQKQRVNLARAVYSNCDTYLLDDPLSAVDSHVGKHIFENVIGRKGLLGKKTRILVTHGLTHLPEMDQIYVLKEGEVSERGTYKELLDKKGAFAEFLITHLQEVDDTHEDLELVQQLQLSNPELVPPRSRKNTITSETGSAVSLRRELSENEKANGGPVPAQGQKLIETEKAETGSVKWDVYAHYFRAVGWFLTLVTILLTVLYQAFSIGSNLWLSAWSSDTHTVSNDTESIDRRNLYLEVYAALGLGQAVTTLLASFTVAEGSLEATNCLHSSLLGTILRAPSSFYDTTPVGRIVNRFSKDVDTVDVVLPPNIRTWQNCLFAVIATVVVISYSTPPFIAVIVPMSFVYYFIQRFYVATSRQLKRMESVSRSPIYSHFGESVTGASVIRAFGVTNRFIKESEERVDFNQVCYFPSIIANRWLAVRLETIGNLIILFAALFSVFGRDSLSAGIVGLSISYALQITQTLNWLVRMTSDVETNIVAVERIKEYGETNQEAAWFKPDNAPGPSWPVKGEVIFKDLKVRYREGLELVLKGISFEVKGGEKVGIVGRTGAGKSSLTLSLFRIIEPAGGTIYIDDVDISTLGLHDLRSRLTIIPQDPVLFSGTLRINLDPIGSFSDENIWRALEHSHLKNFVKSLPAGLQHEVSEGGENLSVGQRQLICLARALLRKTKILILDEATAAVDLETDDLIQTTIRSEFKDCTILTIAHRLNTILDSDRVLVLDAGLVVEFEAPSKLLKNRNSLFYSMAKDAGLVNEGISNLHSSE